MVSQPVASVVAKFVLLFLTEHFVANFPEKLPLDKQYTDLHVKVRIFLFIKSTEYTGVWLGVHLVTGAYKLHIAHAVTCINQPNINWVCHCAEKWYTIINNEQNEQLPFVTPCYSNTEITDFSWFLRNFEVKISSITLCKIWFICKTTANTENSVLGSYLVYLWLTDNAFWCEVNRLRFNISESEKMPSTKGRRVAINSCETTLTR